MFGIICLGFPLERSEMIFNSYSLIIRMNKNLRSNSKNPMDVLIKLINQNKIPVNELSIIDKYSIACLKNQINFKEQLINKMILSNYETPITLKLIDEQIKQYQINLIKLEIIPFAEQFGYDFKKDIDWDKPELVKQYFEQLNNVACISRKIDFIYQEKIFVPITIYKDYFKTLLDNIDYLFHSHKHSENEFKFKEQWDLDIIKANQFLNSIIIPQKYME